MILVVFFLTAAIFKLFVLHTNFIHVLAVVIVFKAVGISSSIRSTYGLSSRRYSCLFSILHQQGRGREMNFDFSMVLLCAYDGRRLSCGISLASG